MFIHSNSMFSLLISPPPLPLEIVFYSKTQSHIIIWVHKMVKWQCCASYKNTKVIGNWNSHIHEGYISFTLLTTCVMHFGVLSNDLVLKDFITETLARNFVPWTMKSFIFIGHWISRISWITNLRSQRNTYSLV